MKKEWRDSDFTPCQRSHEYLQALVEQGCSDMASVKSFCRQFKTISSALIVTHKLDALTQTLWFLKALPEELQKRVIRKCGADNDVGTMDFNRFYAFVTESLEQERVFKTLIQ